MQKVSSIGFENHSEAFSIATLMLARLRRVAGRVIDVMYLVENKTYAQYVIELSVSVQDMELKRHALRLQHLLDEEEPEIPVESVRTMQATQDEEYVSGATEEEIYRAQVSHHYIGALR
ncbi:hypothetical protein [Acinetobacter sp. P8-3-8]|uniref:hypothetical protein n=1 Tax=Acinetobacter sp. P8-3-8 TaxID=1029823 RepID=UPI00024875C1|nr:hypothetical protein [Acinetobacter sp. P8-3-8]